MIESHVRSVRDFIFWANNFHISAYSKYYCKLDLLFLGTFKILVLELSHQLTTTQLKKENEQIINSSPCRRINHITTRIVEWLDNITYVYTRGMYIILYRFSSPFYHYNYYSLFSWTLFGVCAVYRQRSYTLCLFILKSRYVK